MSKIKIKFTQEQKSTLQNLIDIQSYPEAYRYARDIAKDYPSADQRITNWLDNAASINADDGSFKSEFVRSATIEAANDNGMTVTNELFQYASDDLAQNGLSGFVSKGGISDLNSIITEDVQAVVQSFGIGPEGWAGTFAATWPVSIGPFDSVGLGLSDNGSFYKDLHKSFTNRGIDNFFESSLMWVDILENNAVGLGGVY